jgi:large subunit ribosomal protein L10
VLRSEKKQFVSELEKICKDSEGIFVTHYRGMTVSEIFNFKKSLKDKQVHFKVVKNTLAKIAAHNAGKDELVGMFSGPVAIAYSNDVVAAAKLVDAYSKTNSKLKIVGGSINGSVVGAEEVSEIAKLPSFEEIRSRLIATIQAPAIKIARVLKAPAENVARVLVAYAEKQ